jgi:2-C-methyl-D-erythritol 4-phosphate cytidylyltransferase
MNVTAIIPAAGKGVRMGGAVQKPFYPLKGRPLLAYTLDVFEACHTVDHIVLVVSEEMVNRCASEIVDAFGYKKVYKVVRGGEHRQDSVHNGLRAAGNGCDIVVIHDGARPFVSAEVIAHSIELCQEHQAVIAAIAPKNTIKRGEDGFIIATLDRSKLWTAQTPQTFSYDLIVRAYEKAYEDQFWGTDDASLVERLGRKVRILEGSYDNIKITTQEDLYLAEKLLEQRRG